ncbi:lipoprotein, putative [[Synechococcus] sp. NIES-970]|nr:lipoprotein, putative [[Synechococcus] sp. NIES-970]
MNMLFSLALIALTLSLGGCGQALFYQPQIATGGINSNFAEEFPSYSGDGRYLAFASERDGRRNIFLYDLQTNQLVNLPNLNRRDSSQDQPDLSETGRFIAYISTERGRQDVFVYDRERGRSQLLTVNLRGSVQNPTISGNGQQVAFQSNEQGQWNLMLVEVTF